MRRRRRRQRIFAVALGIVVVLVVAGFGFLAFAAKSNEDQIADGVSIAGIDVGGLDKAQALERLEQEVGAPARQPVTVSVRGKERELSAEDAGVAVDLPGAVDRALTKSHEGNFISRGWREVSGGTVNADVGAAVTANRRAIKRFVKKIQTDVAVTPVNAELSLSTTDVAVKAGKKGKKLTGVSALQRRVYRGFTVRGATRDMNAKIVSVNPKTTAADVWAAHPMIATVSRATHTVRVFKEGELVKTYNVAVGEPKYPTPAGEFVVQHKQVNPPWNVPDSDWAGDLAGTTIPGGAANNPLKARWIGFNGSVGFHGTGDIGSLGSSASHGCIRMAPADVIDLYDRLDEGDTVLVA